MKFKLTDTETGEDLKPEPYQAIMFDGRVGYITIDEDLRAEDDPVIARIFTGLTDVMDTDIYFGDVMLLNGERVLIDYLTMQAAFFGMSENNDIFFPMSDLVDDNYVVVGNRWQPEFKGVFGD